MKVAHRVPEIDGLRALAILLVLFLHAQWPIFWSDTGGQIGVDVFFVISGFVITQTMAREWKNTGRFRFKKFYLRRLARLTPALVTMVAITVPLGLVVFSKPELLLLNAFAALTYSYPIFMGLMGFNHLGYDHAWTLSLEGYFYLAFPLLFVGAKMAPFRKSISNILANCFAYRTDSQLPAGFLGKRRPGHNCFWT
jgi:peptidoglycan/LPS O-acetylase OafA/YrhL